MSNGQVIYYLNVKSVMKKEHFGKTKGDNTTMQSDLKLE